MNQCEGEIDVSYSEPASGRQYWKKERCGRPTEDNSNLCWFCTLNKRFADKQKQELGEAVYNAILNHEESNS